MSEDVFRWVIAVGVLLACLASVWQAFILAGLFRAGKEAQKGAQEAKDRFGPLVDRFEAILTASSQLLEENRPSIAGITAETLAIAKSTRPRIAEIAADTVAIAKVARQQAERIGELMDETSDRARARIAQIDETVGRAVGEVDQAREAVKSAVLKPVKEVNGLVAGVKAAFTTMAQGGNRNSPEHATQDEEMFI
jgi:ABC-type transporter Mla subunit MlaD